jgi:hypothetical protein
VGERDKFTTALGGAPQPCNVSDEGQPSRTTMPALAKKR